jgi:dTDP-4-amino-4,6-dideoxygalactose transaminase
MLARRCALRLSDGMLISPDDELLARPDDELLAVSERNLQENGDTAAGAGWPNELDRRIRFDVMLDVLDCPPDSPVTLCDFACGTGELLAHIHRRGLHNITYLGVDRSAKALSYARAKFPEATFLELDVNAPDANLGVIACDYLLANGLFTVKYGMSHEQMWSFVVATIERLWPQVRRGLAFNVMSKVVDWEREDLFHLPMDDAARLLHRLAGRRVRMRADYGLYEYTAYAYRGEPWRRPRPALTAAQPAPAVAKAAEDRPLPVLRPLLPTAERIEPYLRRIDASRIYSNHGPLVCELERRLAEHLALPAGSVASASSGTAALMGAIIAAAGRSTPERPLALMPACTFVATAVAAEQCGYQPYLADIDAESWMLDANRLTDHPVLAKVGVVIPVAPFGRPVPQLPWQHFRDQTGIPVVIDGAASFGAGRGVPEHIFGAVPVVLSLHATKGFGIGEGGAVVWSDPDRIDQVTRALNFGFFGTRDSRSASTNGKMSEYLAAVGHASLDGWTQTRQAFVGVATRYRRAAKRGGLSDRLFAPPDIGMTYVIFACLSSEEAARVQDALRGDNIDSRLWYGGGLQTHSYFANLPGEQLRTTEQLMPRLLGLPMALDLTDDEIERVVSCVTGAVRGSD